MAKHYVRLSDALGAFDKEVNSTGQTLPCDTGDASVTLFRQGQDLYAGIQTQHIPKEVKITAKGGKELATMQTTDAPAGVDLEGATWYKTGTSALVDQADVLLQLETREKAIDPNMIKAKRDAQQRRDGGRQ